MILVIILGCALAATIAALSLVSFKLYMKLTTGICQSQVCLRGKTALVLGANTGIGYETAIDFAKRGARVILAGRNETKTREACEKIIEETHNTDVSYKLVDLTSFASVRKFASEINAHEDRLDILVNNAGAGQLGNKITEDGISIVMQTNYFSHFLLIMLLIDLMKKHPSRIVNVSSQLARRGKINFDKLTSFTTEVDQYNTSKLCQILFTIELARRFKDKNIIAYSLHPGVIRTELYRNFSPIIRWLISLWLDSFGKTATEGAQTQIHCAVANGLEEYSGEHFHDCKKVPRYKSAEDPASAKKLWEESERIVQLTISSGKI